MKRYQLFINTNEVQASTDSYLEGVFMFYNAAKEILAERFADISLVDATTSMVILSSWDC